MKMGSSAFRKKSCDITATSATANSRACSDGLRNSRPPISASPAKVSSKESSTSCTHATVASVWKWGGSASSSPSLSDVCGGGETLRLLLLPSPLPVAAGRRWCEQDRLLVLPRRGLGGAAPKKAAAFLSPSRRAKYARNTGCK